MRKFKYEKFYRFYKYQNIKMLIFKELFFAFLQVIVWLNSEKYGELSGLLSSILSIPIIILTCIIIIKLMRFFKIDEEGHDLISSTIEVDKEGASDDEMAAYGDSNENSLVNNNSFIEVDNEVYIDDKMHKFYFGGVKYKKIKIKKSKLKDFLIWYSLVSIVITSLIFQYYLLILLFPITYYLIKSSIKLYKKKTDIIDYSNKSYFNLINPNFMNLHILPVIPIYDIIDDAYKNIIFKISFYLILLSLPLLILYIVIPEINVI